MLKRVAAVVVGLALVTGVGIFLYSSLESPAVCDVCYRPLHEGTFYRIHLADGKSVDVCCPRCGLRFQEGRQDVVGAEVADFYTQEHVDAMKAVFVENSSMHTCSHAPVHEDRSGTQYEVAWDRCLPSLVGFKSRAEAMKFQEQYGGAIETYAELLQQQ